MDNGAVSIVGGGPAGCSSGIHLSKLGFDKIVIYEKSPNVRKPCGGALSPRLLKEYKEFLKDINIYPLKKCVLDFDGNILNIEFKRKMGGFVDRFEFDKNMRELSESYGVKIVKKSARVEDIKDRIVINASGFNGAGRIGIAIQSFARMKDPEVRFIFRKKLTHLGYYWILPVSEDCVNIGVGGVVGTLKMPINRAFDSFVKEFKMKVKKKYANPFSLFNGFNNLVNRVNNRTVLNVGEAAGLVNPLSGEGIYHAVRSGELAAKSLIAEEPHKVYEKSVKAAFRKEFLLSRTVEKIAAHCPPIMERLIAITIFKLFKGRL